MLAFTFVSVSDFDLLPDGRPVHLVELGAAPGVVLRLLTLGATVHDLEVTGGDGRRRHVVLGHASSADHLASTDYIGGTIGRYANRIRAGHLPLGDEVHALATHDRGNHLHGGPDGFDRRLWELVGHDGHRARLRLVSPDGDQGFPGRLVAEVEFTVSETSVSILFEASCDRATVVNLTQHSYFNLDGRGAGTVDGHLLTVPASAYTPVDASGIPVGRHEPVAGTPFDFRSPTRVGAAIRSGHPQVVAARGIDHNLVVDGDGLRVNAVLESPAAATRLTIRSDQPGLQVYTGNFLDGARVSVDDGVYRQGDGIALEPQLFPDSPHHEEWPSPVLAPGERYRARHEWAFSPLTGTP